MGELCFALGTSVPYLRPWTGRGCCSRVHPDTHSRRNRVLGGLPVRCSESNGRQSPSIRTADEQDIEKLVEIYADAFLPSVGPLSDFRNKWKKNDIRKQMEDMFRYVRTEGGPLNRVFLAEALDDDEAIGFVQLMMMPCPIPLYRQPAPMMPYIGNLSVLTKRRRQGVATALVEYCEKHSLESGFEEIFLHVAVGNQPASNMYRKLGYRAELIDPEYYTARGRTRKVYLRKELGQEVTWLPVNAESEGKK